MSKRNEKLGEGRVKRKPTQGRGEGRNTKGTDVRMRVGKKRFWETYEEDRNLKETEESSGEGTAQVRENRSGQ